MFFRALPVLLLIGSIAWAAPVSSQSKKPGRKTASVPFSLLGEFRGSRLSDRTEGPKYSALKRLDTRAGLLVLEVDFGEGEKRSGRKTPGFHEVALSLDRFQALFEAPQPMESSEWQDGRVTYQAGSEFLGDVRKVTFKSSRKGLFGKTHEEVLAIRLQDGEFNELTLTQKYRSGWKPFGVLEEYFHETLFSSHRTAEGLDLRDDSGSMGRVTAEEDIRQAVEQPSSETFHRLIQKGLQSQYIPRQQ